MQLTVTWRAKHFVRNCCSLKSRIESNVQIKSNTCGLVSILYEFVARIFNLLWEFPICCENLNLLWEFSICCENFIFAVGIWICCENFQFAVKIWICGELNSAVSFFLLWALICCELYFAVSFVFLWRVNLTWQLWATVNKIFNLN